MLTQFCANPHRFMVNPNVHFGLSIDSTIYRIQKNWKYDVYRCHTICHCWAIGPYLVPSLGGNKGRCHMTFLLLRLPWDINSNATLIRVFSVRFKRQTVSFKVVELVWILNFKRLVHVCLLWSCQQDCPHFLSSNQFVVRFSHRVDSFESDDWSTGWTDSNWMNQSG